MNDVKTTQSDGWRGFATAAICGAGGYLFFKWFVLKWLADNGVLCAYEPMIKAAFARDGWWMISGWVTVAFFGFMGLILTIASLRGRWIQRVMSMQPGEPLDKPRQMVRISGIGGAAYGLLVTLFLMPGIDPLVGVVVGVAAFGLITILFFWGLRISDELQRAVQNEALVGSFIVIEAVLVLWALLNHFGFVGPMKALPVVLLITWVYLATLMVVASRRGLDQ